MTRTTINTSEAPAAIGAYSQAVNINGTVYLSGQIPLLPGDMTLVEDPDRQIHQVFKNLGAVTRAAGGSLNEVVKLTVYLTDLSLFARVNEIMAEYFDQPFPARAAVGVAELPKGAAIEVEGIMVLA
ncbi:MAG TPA: Rid family detoxifying hydrolase [Gammaproteobacteria bacterium]|nr:Rid family detoxifying hydrolase [Gammaproteobacteria bacterium]